MSFSETSTVACHALLPARRQPEHDGGLLRALSRSQRAFLARCTSDQTTAVPAERKIIKTTATAAPNPVTPSVTRRKAEAGGRIQPKLISRGSRVYRFSLPAGRTSGGAADAIDGRTLSLR